MAKNRVAPPSTTISRPANITLPPRSSSADNSFLAGFAGFSPGPMTLVSSLFADSDTPRSFSQLLAGAMASPSAAAVNHGGVSEDPVSVTPSGQSPSGLLNSIGMLSPAQSPFGMSHQQALAQVTAQAALAQSNNFNPVPAAYDLNPLADPHESDCNKQSSTTNTEQQKQVLTSDSKISFKEPSDVFLPSSKSQSSVVSPDKPEDDGYNWRKYGQKQVKGSDYPRSYYRCSHLSCPVKKKVERSPEGQIIEIIYKGQHTHQSPPKKPAKGGSLPAENMRSEANPDTSQLKQTEVPRRSVEAEPAQLICWEDQELVQKSSIELLPIDAKKLKYETEGSPDINSDPTRKRRKTGAGSPEPTSSHNTVVEEKVIVQTRSEVDLLDDGFRWRKYGQKAVKGNTHPRSYYKCTTPGCRVRKHVERASADPKSVITTYEGKHNHEFPAGRGNSHNVPS